MSGPLLNRGLRALGMAALCSVTLVPNLRAEPITVTSGQFVLEIDDLTFLSISGTDGFFLFASFIGPPSSPQQTCSFRCAPGTAVSMSAVAGGSSAGFRIGTLLRANINGREFRGRGTGAPTLRGTLLFEAPILTLPPANPSDAFFTAPFHFNGQVTGFAEDDVDARVPLFQVALVGQGTVSALFLSDAGSYIPENVTYTFLPDTAPIPEPTAVALFGSGLIGLVARAWKRKRTPRELA